MNEHLQDLRSGGRPMKKWEIEMQQKDKEIERLNNTLEAYKNKDSDTTQWLIEDNEEIERLKIDYQQANEVLAEQSEEIERLNEEIKGYEQERERVLNIIDERNHKAIEYIEKHCRTNPHLSALLVDSEIIELLEILKGDKE